MYRLFFSISLEELQEQKVKAEDNLALINKKIAFCQENKLDAFDPEEYRIFELLEIAEGSGTRMQKAKALAEALRK